VLLRLDSVSLAFGARPLLDAVELSVAAGERVALVGRNGEGKSSLLRLVAGLIPPDSGNVWRRPGLRRAWLAQDLDEAGDGSVRDIVAAGLQSPHDGDESWQQQQRLNETLARLDLDGAADFSALSGGWRRRALLARALVCEPQLLLLDEPTNHLDIEAIEWLETLLGSFGGALLFVSHDRTFIDHVATRIVDLDRGHLSNWPGSYQTYTERKAAELAAQAQQQALFDKRLAQEEVWIRKGVEARRTRNEGRVRALYQMREQRRARRERIGRVNLTLQQAAQSGELVFEAERASVAFGERTVIRDLDVTIMRGDRIGIVGPNGAGKSTLIRLLLGEIEPRSGRMRRGTKLQPAYYDQQRAQLQLERSLMENVCDRGDQVVVNGQARHVSGYLRDFLFRDEQLRTPAAALSGGERNRLLLARLFVSPANLLVMDEPTNDLDIDTLELLEEMATDFSGTLLLVSHDRAFLDHVVTSLLVLDGNGGVEEFVGGYSDWLRYRSERAAAARAMPAAASRAAPAAVAAKRNGRLGYMEQREFAALPATIEQLEAEQVELTRVVNDPQFYAGDAAAVQGRLQQLQQLAARIETAYARWAALEDKLAGR